MKEAEDMKKLLSKKVEVSDPLNARSATDKLGSTHEGVYLKSLPPLGADLLCHPHSTASALGHLACRLQPYG